MGFDVPPLRIATLSALEPMGTVVIRHLPSDWTAAGTFSAVWRVA
jgi:hypothetical protein